MCIVWAEIVVVIVVVVVVEVVMLRLAVDYVVGVEVKVVVV